MRLAGLCLCIVMFASACKNKGDAEGAPDPAAIKAQQELVARRDSLLAQRDKLQGESTKLQEEIVKVQASGGDITELEKKKKEVDSQLEAQSSNLDTTSSELDKISSKLDAAGGVAAREARVAEREARVAEREKAAMNKMQQLMELESKNAEKWKDSCNTGGSTTVIQQIAPPKSGNYTRKEVDSLMGKAKAGMNRKGLLGSDLGAQAALEGEITKALQESDWTRGYILASQLVQTIDGITVNRNFIKAKYDRLQSRVKAAKPEAAVNAQLEAGMGEVMQKYGDGDFSAANRKINQLYGLLR